MRWGLGIAFIERKYLRVFVVMYLRVCVCMDANNEMITVVGNGHRDPSSKPGRCCLYFILC